MPNIRRGFAPGTSGDEAVAARANGGSIASRNGSDSAMPVPRKKWRRDMARRVAMNGAPREFDFMEFFWVGAMRHFIWKRSLCTISWMSARTP